MASKKRIQLATKKSVAKRAKAEKGLSKRKKSVGTKELELRRKTKKQREIFARGAQLKFIRSQERKQGKASTLEGRAADKAAASKLGKGLGSPKAKQVLSGIERTRARARKLSAQRKKKK